MTEKQPDYLSVVPPRQYDAGVEAAALAIEQRFRPAEFAMYANTIQQGLDETVRAEIREYAIKFEPMMSKNPADRNTSLARLIIRAAMQAENDIDRRAHKKLRHPQSP